MRCGLFSMTCIRPASTAGITFTTSATTKLPIGRITSLTSLLRGLVDDGCQTREDGQRRPSSVILLKSRQRGADRPEWAIFVLLFAEAVRIRAIWRIDRFLQKIEPFHVRPRLRHEIRGDIP